MTIKPTDQFATGYLEAVDTVGEYLWSSGFALRQVDWNECAIAMKQRQCWSHGTQQANFDGRHYRFMEYRGGPHTNYCFFLYGPDIDTFADAILESVAQSDSNN